MNLVLILSLGAGALLVLLLLRRVQNRPKPPIPTQPVMKIKLRAYSLGEALKAAEPGDELRIHGTFYGNTCTPGSEITVWGAELPHVHSNVRIRDGKVIANGPAESVVTPPQLPSP